MILCVVGVVYNYDQTPDARRQTPDEHGPRNTMHVRCFGRLDMPCDRAQAHVVPTPGLDLWCRRGPQVSCRLGVADGERPLTMNGSGLACYY